MEIPGPLYGGIVAHVDRDRLSLGFRARSSSACVARHASAQISHTATEKTRARRRQSRGFANAAGRPRHDDDVAGSEPETAGIGKVARESLWSNVFLTFAAVPP